MSCGLRGSLGFAIYKESLENLNPIHLNKTLIDKITQDRFEDEFEYKIICDKLEIAMDGIPTLGWYVAFY